jgi:DNA-3-methyladenine glycosylase I
MDAERCAWARSEPCLTYHDTEWGVPVYDEQLLFEMLTLEGAQAGLSWQTVLKKREGYRRAFHNFDIQTVSRMTEADVETLMLDAGIIRNRAKILSTINNAKRILELQASGTSFSETVWSFVDGSPVVGTWQTMSDLPAKTEASIRMSKSLLKLGFKFVGPTICYAFMQASGLVDDHVQGCFRRQSD